jgi:hypothetical protein
MEGSLVLPPAVVEPKVLCLACKQDLSKMKEGCFIPRSRARNAKRIKPFCNEYCAALFQGPSAEPRFEVAELAQFKYRLSAGARKGVVAKKRVQPSHSKEKKEEEPKRAKKEEDQPANQNHRPSQDIPAVPLPAPPPVSDMLVSAPQWVLRYHRPGSATVEIPDPTDLLEGARRANIPANRFSHLMVAEVRPHGITLYPRCHAPAEYVQHYKDEHMTLNRMQVVRTRVLDKDAQGSFPLAKHPPLPKV